MKNVNTTYRGSNEDFLKEGSGKGGIFGYIRRSAQDRSSHPLESQIGTINKYIEEYSKSRLEGYANVRTYYIDNGVSGSLAPEKRNGMNALILEIKDLIEMKRNNRITSDTVSSSVSSKTRTFIKGGIHVITFDATRLARSLNIGTSLKSLFENLGITLHLAQPRMVVEGSNADMFYGLNLQMASAERIATIKRVKNSFEHKDWDPRKSFGWKFEGSGNKPIELPEEQIVLDQIKNLYEKDGLKMTEIVKIIQTETGGRRVRKNGVETDENVKIPWTTTELSFLAKKHKWVWGGGKSVKALELEIISEREKSEFNEDIGVYNLSLEIFLEKNRGTFIDGVKLNRAMLKRFFPESQNSWKKIGRAHV